MLKWVFGIIGFLVLLFVIVLIVKPEWLGTFGTIFTDFIQANET